MMRALVLAAATAASLSAPGLLSGQALAQGRGAPPPPGNYFQTCRNVSTQGFGANAVMTAECRTRDGGWRQTSIRFGGCDRIDNRNGQLSCLPAQGSPGPSPGVPQGPPPGPPYGGESGGGHGRPSITLFSGPDFGGRPFFSEREITNLPRENNDRALSLRIEGRRAWMICTDSDFRGRCQVFDHDVRDLRQFGLGGQISSMRPIR
jgi:hypothetical protein